MTVKLCALLVCVLSVCGALLVSVSAADGDNIPTEIDGAPIPRLRPMSKAEANQLLRYVRLLQTPVGPVPWSAIYSGCVYRRLLAYWAIATSPNRPLTDADRPVLNKTKLNAAEIAELLRAPTRDVAIISTAAELGMKVRWIYPNGTDVDTALSDTELWAEHYTVVINVEGTIKVVDLSIGDEPVDIQDWFHGMVPPRHKYCWHLNATEFKKLWLFWVMAGIGNQVPPADQWPAPDRQCGYSITLWNEDRNLVNEANLVGDIDRLGKQLMDAYHEALPNEPQLTREQLPFFRLHYTPMTTEQICAYAHLAYCPTSSTTPAAAPCDSSPCANGASCRNVYYGTVSDHPSFQCTCADGFAGDMCDQKDPCASSPCVNGGMCSVRSDGSGFNCDCPTGYDGSICDQVTPCASSPCQHDGFCRKTLDGGFRCMCYWRYTGYTCDKATTCADEPCFNGGSCRETSDGLVCDCPSGFSGENCNLADTVMQSSVADLTGGARGSLTIGLVAVAAAALVAGAVTAYWCVRRKRQLRFQHSIEVNSPQPVEFVPLADRAALSSA